MGEDVKRVVQRALEGRDLDDPESMTEATTALCPATETLLERPLTPDERRRLHALVARGSRPLAIMRQLHRWHGGLSDRLARQLATRRDVSAFIWG